MFKLNPFVAAAGFSLLAAGTGLASDLKIDGQASVQRPIGYNVQVTLEGNSNLTTLLAVGTNPGPTWLFGENVAIGMSPVPSLFAFPDTDATGQALMNFELPTDPIFIGVSLHLLGIIVDPADANGLDFSSRASLSFMAPSVHGQNPMAAIPGGTFVMGDHHGVGYSRELPLHSVTLDPFLLDVYETTNDAYAAYLNSALSLGLIEVSSGGAVSKAGGGEDYFSTDSASSYSRIVWSGTAFSVEAGKGDHPVNMVSWYGAAAFANWRSAQDGLTPCYDLSTWICNFLASGYRLPTEAEWEYAARGGEHAPYYQYPWGNTLSGSQANYWSSGDPYEITNPYISPVGYYDGGQTPGGVDMANGYGLYDMSGNVFEWCNDWYSISYYALSQASNPTGPAPASYRVFRGGSSDFSAGYLRSAYRNRITPDNRYRYLGFRLARVPTE